MTGNLFLTLPAAAAYVSLATVVLIKNPRDRINRYFGMFSVAVAAWTISNGLVNTYAANPSGYLWGRLTFASASIITTSFFLFVGVFPSATHFPPPYLTKLVVLSGLGAFIASLSPYIVRETTASSGALTVVYGPLHPLFGAYFVGCFGLVVATLIQKLRSLSGTQKLQLRYLFLGILITGVGATITNLLFPLVLHTSRFSQYGPLLGLFMIAMIAHAIVRHRLMNIRLVLRRSVVLLLAIAIAGCLFLGLLGIMTAFLFPRHRDLPLWVDLSLVLLIALLFHPLRQHIQIYLDRYLYREPYDYQRTIREATHTIGSMLDLKPLLNHLCGLIARTLRPEMVSIYIKNPEGPGYTQMATRRFVEEITKPDCEATLPENSPLTDLLAQTRTYLLGDDVHDNVTGGKPNPLQNAAILTLAALKGEMALPILHQQQLAGFLIVAQKLSGDPYFAEDIDLLSTLVGQATIAIKNAQLYQELALINEYVTNIVTTMESGVVAVDTVGRVTLFNPAAERITGLGRQVIHSGSVSSLPPTLAHPLQATLTDGQPRVHAEVTICDTLGHRTPISSSTHALRDGLGHVLGAVAVFSDLTRLKELEGEKRRTERLASIGALASGIAHEIKNPLVAIKTFAELLPERFSEQDFREDFSRVVIREVARIDDLVARLRGLAAPATRPLPTLDLLPPIEETLVLLRGHLEKKRIKVRRLYDRVLPQVSGDPAQLKQLFLNLFMNALEAMESGGELTIRLASAEREDTPSLLVEVSDTGTGIPEEMIGKIFDPFVTTKPRGSGLGLAICRGIADAHRATIRAQNNPNRRGTTVTIEFAPREETATHGQNVRVGVP